MYVKVIFGLFLLLATVAEAAAQQAVGLQATPLGNNISFNGTPSPTSSDYIVIHQQPSIAEALGAASRKSSLSAASKKQLSLNQRRTIETEQNKFKQNLSAMGAAANRTTSVKAVLNATILKGLSENKFKELKARGFDIRPAQAVRTTLFDSVPLINATQVWQRTDSGGLTVTGKGVTVGVVDTGVDYSHPDLGGCTRDTFLAGNCSKVKGGYNFVALNNDPMDDHFHGTHVAATIAGNGVLKGVAPDADIYAYKALNAEGIGYTSDIIAAMERAADPNQDGDTSDHLDIVSLSIGGPGTPDDEQSVAMEHLVDLGVVAVVAAGNSGPGANTVMCPGCARKVITVAASFPRNYDGGPYWDAWNPRTDNITRFSSRGPTNWNSGYSMIAKPDITAPGALICAARLSTYNADPAARCIDDNHVLLSGTSMATPHVSGVAALLLQAHPDWTPEQIKNALRATAIDLTNPDTHVSYSSFEQGAGRVDALAALNANGSLPVAFLEDGGITSGQNIPLRGSAYGPGFARYVLEYAANTGGPWHEFAASSSPVVNGLLGELPTVGLDSTPYQIRLSVFSTQGKSVAFTALDLRNVLITSPSDVDTVWGGSPLNGYDDIVVRGSAIDADFDHYALQLCFDVPSTLCVGTPELTSGGTSQVADSVLGVFKPGTDPSIVTGAYHLILTVFDRQGRRHTAERHIYIDRRLLSGLPKRFEYAPCAQPLITDIDGDGNKEMVMSSGESVTVTDAQGNPKAGWPVSPPFWYIGDTSCPAVGDINNDGRNEVVFRHSQEFYVYSAAGELLPGWPQPLPPSDSLQMTFYRQAPMITDVDLDGYQDIVFTPRNILDRNGNPLAGYHVDPAGPADGWLTGGMAAGDLNGDGYPELVFHLCADQYPSGTWYYHGAFICSAGILRIVDHTGALIAERRLESAVVTSPPIIADIDGNGINEAIAVSTHCTTWDRCDYARVDALSISQQGQLPGWPVQLPMRYSQMNWWFAGLSDMAAGDITGDGLPEILVVTAGMLYVVRPDGTLSPGFPDPRDLKLIGTPTIGNIDGDADMEIAIVSLDSGVMGIGREFVKLLAFEKDGTPNERFPILLTAKNFMGTPINAAIADLNGDGKNELALRSRVAFDEDLLIWTTGSCANEREEWPFSFAERATREYQAGTSHCSNIVPPLLCETDTDLDGAPDCLDQCPLASWKVTPGYCGCMVRDADFDGNGTIDSCPSPVATPTPAPAPYPRLPAKRPDKPASVSIKVINGQLVIFWRPPKKQAVIDQYRVTLKRGSAAFVDTSKPSTERYHIAQTPLSRGKYTAKVWAVNRRGAGKAAEKSINLKTATH